MPSEVWKDLPPEFGGSVYQVNRKGDFYSRISRKELKLRPSNARVWVRLKIDGVMQDAPAANIVAKVFLGPPPSPSHVYVSYKNNDHLNISASNLYWHTEDWFSTQKRVQLEQQEAAKKEYLNTEAMLRWKTQGATNAEIQDHFGIPAYKLKSLILDNLDKYRVRLYTDDYVIRWYYKDSPLGLETPEGFTLVSNLSSQRREEEEADIRRSRMNNRNTW